ncbi:MAG: pseudouridine synthase [Alphaproteobacteria bacterium CG11_big_fil_rev_8_21_14_0_20_39_49]|nr:MAG: pseudouridine synthase [Alphaproteobacteria bacterium CG11_big_fil_rev_8_21_14_0_20_39_49]
MQDSNRIAKVIARSGLCSRRDAEKWILAGRVKIDGKVIDKPSINVTDKNTILIDDKPLPKIEEEKLWIFHKPKGCITSTDDPQGRQTVFDLLPEDMPRVITIGRLDYNTEGLLLLTNSGELARHIELPSTGWVRTYRVRAYGNLNKNKLEDIKNGVVIDKIKYAPAKINVERSNNKNHWITISITEGKNREVRKLLEYTGLSVNRLIRTSYGIFELGKLPVGKTIQIPQKTLYDSKVLK